MRTAFVVLGMVVRRALANRRLLATVLVGVVMASALMSSVVLYSDAVRDLGLRYALRNAEPKERNVRVVTGGRPALEDYRQRREQVDRLLEQYLGDVLEGVVHFGRTATFYVARPGAPVPQDADRPRGHFQFADGLREHVEVVEGAWPRLPAAGSSPPVLEAAIGRASADRIGVHVGDAFDLHPFWREDAAPVRVVVTAIVAPRDPEEPYWFGRTDRFALDTTWDTYPFWVDEAAVAESVAPYLPDMDSTLETYGFVDIGAIDARNAKAVEASTRALAVVLREAVPNVVFETRLADVIASYQSKLFFTRLPLFALMLQIVGIALYYLVMVSSMLVERQHGEIALLRSRGGSPGQVVAVYGIEAALICGAGALAGPFLAAGAIAVLGYTPPFAPLSGDAALEVPLSTMAFLAAGGGAALAFAAMLIPAWRASRSTTIDYKHSLARPQTTPLFLKYYLDLALVGVGAFLFYQLRERGSLVTERLFGDLSADPLLLLSPTLFMVMVALVFLRLFPLVLGAFAWAGRRWESATVALGLTRMTRAPLQYNRLILLLLLATAVGMFAAGYRATLERGYDDRAAYEAGAESRLTDVRNPANVPGEVFVERVRQATGAETVSPASRLTGSYLLSAFQGVSIEVLGVVPGEFERVAFWRDDFAGADLGELLDRLEVDLSARVRGPEVPAGSRWIGAWARVPYGENQLRLGLRLRDPNGTFWDYTLVPTEREVSEGWRFFAADLTQPSQARFGAGTRYSTATPKELDAVYVRTAGSPPPVAERAIILVDDVIVFDGVQWSGPDRGGWTAVETFDSFERWQLITGQAQADPGAVSFAPGAGRDGGAAGDAAAGAGRIPVPRAGSTGDGRRADHLPEPAVRAGPGSGAVRLLPGARPAGQRLFAGGCAACGAGAGHRRARAGRCGLPERGMAARREPGSDDAGRAGGARGAGGGRARPAGSAGGTGGGPARGGELGRHPVSVVRGRAGADGARLRGVRDRGGAGAGAGVRHPADDGIFEPTGAGAGEFRAAIRHRGRGRGRDIPRLPAGAADDRVSWRDRIGQRAGPAARFAGKLAGGADRVPVAGGRVRSDDNGAGGRVHAAGGPPRASDWGGVDATGAGVRCRAGA